MKKLILAVLIGLCVLAYAEDRPDKIAFTLGTNIFANNTTNTVASTAIEFDRRFYDATILATVEQSVAASTSTVNGFRITLQGGYEEGESTTNWVDISATDFVPQHGVWDFRFNPRGTNFTVVATNLNLRPWSKIRSARTINLSGGTVSNLNLYIIGHTEDD